jgi:hypothetical protein
LFDQVNPEMSSGPGNGGEPVSSTAVAASSASSSTAHASAAVAHPPAFVVTRAMTDEAWSKAKEVARHVASWSKLSKDKQKKLFDTQLRAVVEREKAVVEREAEKQRADGAEAELAARDASGTLLSSLLLISHL